MIIWAIIQPKFNHNSIRNQTSSGCGEVDLRYLVYWPIWYLMIKLHGAVIRPIRSYLYGPMVSRPTQWMDTTVRVEEIRSMGYYPAQIWNNIRKEYVPRVIILPQFGTTWEPCIIYNPWGAWSNIGSKFANDGYLGSMGSFALFGAVLRYIRYQA